MILLINTATATDSNPFENLELDNETIEMIKQQINSGQTDNKALDTLKNTFSNEILEINLTESNQILTITTENGELKDIKKGTDPNATMQLNVNETIFKDLENAEDPAQIFLDALNSEKIEYQATEKASLKTKIMLFLSKITLKIATVIKGIASIF